MPKKAETQIPLTEAELEIAEKRLGADREWVNALFAQHAIQLGDGRPFPSRGTLHGKRKARLRSTARRCLATVGL